MHLFLIEIISIYDSVVLNTNSSLENNSFFLIEICNSSCDCFDFFPTIYKGEISWSNFPYLWIDLLILSNIDELHKAIHTDIWRNYFKVKIQGLTICWENQSSYSLDLNSGILPDHKRKTKPKRENLGIPRLLILHWISFPLKLPSVVKNYQLKVLLVHIIENMEISVHFFD